MRINWALSHVFVTCDDLDWQRIQNCAPTWSGAGKKAITAQNTICSDPATCLQLLKSAAYTRTNIYVPHDFWQAQGQPAVARVFQGTPYPNIANVDDIIALHLAAAHSDIVLMLGFDFCLKPGAIDAKTAKVMQDYHGLLRSLIVNSPETQFVAIDQPEILSPSYQDIANLTCDTLQAVLTLMEQ
jgi:hypothetical protein